MNNHFIEEALSLFKLSSVEKKKLFFKELQAAQEAYIEISNRLMKESRVFEARARELDLLKKCLGFSKEEEVPDESTK